MKVELEDRWEVESYFQVEHVLDNESGEWIWGGTWIWSYEEIKCQFKPDAQLDIESGCQWWRLNLNFDHVLEVNLDHDLEISHWTLP